MQPSFRHALLCEPGIHNQAPIACRTRVGDSFSIGAPSYQSFSPVLATSWTNWRRRKTNRVTLGISTTDDAALRRSTSTVKPVWHSARPTSSISGTGFTILTRCPGSHRFAQRPSRFGRVAVCRKITGRFARKTDMYVTSPERYARFRCRLGKSPGERCRL
jgi:hypothetical protein